MEYPMLHGTDHIEHTFVWLGGTATEDWDWRKELIPYLDKRISYYDPYIRPGDGLEWDETARQNEQKAKKYAICHVYVLTSGIKGVFSIEEITEAVLTAKDRAGMTVCVAVLDYNNSLSKEMKSSLHACVERWSELGAHIETTLMGVAKYVNSYYAKAHEPVPLHGVDKYYAAARMNSF